MVNRSLLPVVLFVAGITLAGCGLLEPISSTSTPERRIVTAPPISISATVSTVGSKPTVSANVTNTPESVPATPNITPKGTITFAIENFPGYYPGIIMEANGLLVQHGYHLNLVRIDTTESESERYERLKRGEWDIYAATLSSFARYADSSVGAITTLIDESAGADKLIGKPEIGTLNDLRGKRISFIRGSASEFFLYYALSLAGLTNQDVILVPKDTVDEVIQTYRNGEADVISAWAPSVDDAKQHGGREIITSDKLHALVDVLITSRSAINDKFDAVQAFHNAWYEALKLTIDSPDDAGQVVVNWGHHDWTSINNPQDFRASLQTIAQATLQANQSAFQSTQRLINRLDEARNIWKLLGQSPPDIDNINDLVEGRFSISSAGLKQLYSSQTPVNNKFQLTERVELPQLSPEEQQDVDNVVKLPLEQIAFAPESSRLTDKAIDDLTKMVLPKLLSSRLYVKIEGSAAWPGPEGRFTKEDIQNFAMERAVSVRDFLIGQGIDPNRFIISTLEPKFPNSTNEAELVQDRIVRFTLASASGR